MEARVLNLERRHPDYEPRRALTDLLWSSYLGGEDYKGAGMLDRYPRETDAVFSARKKRAYLLNYYAAVIDAYLSAVYRRDPVREPVRDDTQPSETNEEAEGLSPALEAFQEDATGSDVSLTRFMRERATFALAVGKAYLMVDAEGGKPYVHAVHPDNLLDFEQARDGSFLWALIAEKKVEASDPYTERAEADVYRLWTLEEWVLFDKQGGVLEEGRNRARVVPLIEMDGSGVNLPVYDIAQVVRRVYNLCSQLDEILINVTFPQMYAPGDGVEDARGESISEDTAPIEVGTSRVLLLPDEARLAPGFLAPPDGPAELHIKERERLVQAVYSLAGLERRDPDNQNVQSGVAKAYDFRETNARLVSLAQLCERTELAVLELLSAYGVSASANVSYQKDFNVRDFAAMLDNYLKVQGARLPAAAKRRGAMEVSMQLAEEASEEEKREIEEAVKAMSDDAFEQKSTTPILDRLAPLGGLDG